VIVGLVALLLPVGAFVAAAGRFGAEERDRRLATLRLVGADIRATTTIATGEGLVGAIAGVGLGIALFLAARPLTQTISVAGVSVFSADVRPSAPLAAAVVVLVPVTAVAAMVAGMRRVAVAPLGVSRRGQPSRRRLWWRLLTPLLGVMALAPMVGNADRLSDAGGQVEATLGVLLVLVGVSGLLPWLVEGLVRRAPGGSVSWLLAVRRLRAEEGTTRRVVGVIGLAVAGAIALQMVFAAAQAQSDRAIPSGQRLTQSVVMHGAPSRGTPIAAVLRSVPGVDHVAEVSARGGSVTVDVRVRARVLDAPDRVRDAAASLDPLAQVYSAATPGLGHRLANLRRALTAGAFVVLLMIGASLLVAAAEQLRERRRVLAVLSAVGARRSTIARSVLWQSAIPIVCGLVLAVTLGTVLGTVLMHVGGVRVSYDWGAVALLAGAGAATIALVTVLTLPLVVSLMSPDALRVE
jgi:predicted lysophospholipase L1 biosynthesis ABC-type transport system permease subunit